MLLRKLALEIGGEPDASEWPALLEQGLRVEHDALPGDGPKQREQDVAGGGVVLDKTSRQNCEMFRTRSLTLV
jgi:hypothetical protein